MTNRLWMPALLAAGMLLGGIAQAGGMDQTGGIADKLLNTPSVASWNAWGAEAKIHEDDAVTGQHALQIKLATKMAHLWDAAASIPTTKAVKKGDVILAAFWARAEVPAPGKTYAEVPTIAMQLAKAPYTLLFSESAAIGPQWKMYYSSGVADADYDAGQINLTVQLAANVQTVDLGPAFIVNMGTGYDMNKLPHNPQPKATPTPEQTNQPAHPLDTVLANLREKLPVPGTLITDQAFHVYAFGADQTSSQIQDADVPGGQALHVTLAKPAAHSWDDGISIPVTGAIHKGDELVLSVWLRNPADSGSLSIPVFGINSEKPPYTFAVQGKAEVPAGSWHPYYASGTATEDLPAGKAVVTMQLGNATPAIDVGPALALDLGPGVDQTELPK